MDCSWGFAHTSCPEAGNTISTPVEEDGADGLRFVLECSESGNEIPMWSGVHTRFFLWTGEALKECGMEKLETFLFHCV